VEIRERVHEDYELTLETMILKADWVELFWLDFVLFGLWGSDATHLTIYCLNVSAWIKK
jgi:hypothetical protein